MKGKKTLGVLAVSFIIAGVVLTLENYSVLQGIHKLWPLMPLMIGAGFIFLFFHVRKQDAMLMWLGSFLACISIFFLCLNFTSWSSLAHLWPVFLGIVGLCFLAVSIFIRKKVFIYLSVAFVALFLALYFVFTVSSKLWPLSLVVFGMSLIIIDYVNSKHITQAKGKLNEQ